MKYITDKGELKDREIVNALKSAAEAYENGEIIEVRDTLVELLYCIDNFVFRN